MGKLETAVTAWENSLLDLGRRNRMINYPTAQGNRRSQQTLRLDEPDYARLYNLLVVKGKTLAVQQPPLDKFDLRCEAVMRLFERLGKPVVPMQGDVRPAGSFTEYRKILKNMRAKMKLAREEQGVGVLYLAVGFLDWRQLTGKLDSLTSPLLLIPVRLKMKSIRAPYEIEMLDEDVAVNPALSQLFQMEYGLELPELQNPEAPVDDYLDQVEMLAKQHGWAVRREAHLTLLSFQKLSMYHDLRRSHDRIGQSAVLRAISGEEKYPLDASVMDGVALDGVAPEDSHLVVNADSSQLYAVELSRRGVSFCLQGPPGGGKSQTITNIIAQALADGKKVLFVAEKMAALDVVHRRLKDAGLGEFTLALHSHRADRKGILAELSQPMNLPRQELDPRALAALDELDGLRQALNVYPRLMHRLREPLNESLYSVLCELADLKDAPFLPVALSGVENLTRPEMSAEIARVGRMARAHERYQVLPDNPWQGLQDSVATFMARTQLTGEATAALNAAKALRPAVAELSARGLLKEGRELDSLLALSQVCGAAQAHGPVSAAWAGNARRIAALAHQAEENAARVKRADSAAQAVLLPGASLDTEALLPRMTALDSDLRAVLTGERWQQQTDAFATHYAALAARIPHLTDSAEAALSLLGCTARTGADADWCLDAAAALAAAPATTASGIPVAEAIEPILNQVRSVREEGAALTAQAEVLLGRTWAPQVLTLNASGMLRRLNNDYAGLSRLMNIAQYNQDMRQLGSYYNGTSRLDEMTARSFLARLEGWQDQRHAWSLNAYAITQQLGLSAMGPDGDWEAIENQLSALAALGHCADTPRRRQMLDAALEKPDIRKRAAALQEPLRYAAFDRSLRSADFSGDALADDIAHTLRAILTAGEDLGHLRQLQDDLRPSCVPGAAYSAVLSALRAAGESQRRQHLLEEALTGLAPLCPERTLDASADFAALGEKAECVAAALEQAHRLPSGLCLDLLTGKHSLPQLSFAADLPAALAPLEAFAARFVPAEPPLALPFDALASRLERCLCEPDALDLWQAWRDGQAEMAGALLSPFIPAACRARLPENQWADAARKLLLYSWVEAVLAGEPLLSVFQSRAHEENIARFGELDRQQLHIARSRIRKQLVDLTPDEAHRALSATDEMAILQRELMKKRGHLPLRKLFSRIPNLLTTLKPCLMMSPLSVASFLESSELSFDLVIFDEASQIMPENAIGAILRGRQVIIAGDTKQMPPTDFFTASVGAQDYDPEDEEEIEEDLPPEESILEQCAAVLPSCPLLWHYRSRHESLIAFSNREIYAGRLVTFPGSIDRAAHLGVELVHVPEGVFHRRRNRAEAKKCVRLIEEHLLERSHRSLGVVAFSRTQQSAIEEELHRFRMAHPEYDEFFDENRDEPFFIKNLENVQGDERDTMIFSVGYAKKADGKPMSLNLGPLSASGGERRLNVAITRARYNIKLVSSILAGDIDLNRTAAEGTRLLKAYIDYAQRGYAAIEADDAAPQAPSADAFTAHLASVVRAAGYQAETDVGCSGCRVSVAVRHPEDESRYALGIMTDGASYAAQRTCRDRDHLQSSVLSGMGWRLHRVWAADWLKDPAGVERRLLAAVKAAVEAPAPAPDAPREGQFRIWSRPAEGAETPALPETNPGRLPAPDPLALPLPAPEAGGSPAPARQTLSLLQGSSAAPAYPKPSLEQGGGTAPSGVVGEFPPEVTDHD